MKRTPESRTPLALAAAFASALIGLGCAASAAPEGTRGREPEPAATVAGSGPERAPASPARSSRAELLDRLRMPLSRSSEGLRWESRGGRAAVARLQGRAQHAIVAHVGADGLVVTTCVDDIGGAERALGGGAR